MPKFIVKQGVGVGREIPMTGTHLVFGRTDECDVIISDANISRRHCQAVALDGLVAMMDLGSSNGTFVNGLPISRIFLMDGDEIRVGGTVLVYADDTNGGGELVGAGAAGGVRSMSGAGAEGTGSGAVAAPSLPAPVAPGAQGGEDSAPIGADENPVEALDRTQLFSTIADDAQIDALKGVYLKLKSLYRVFHEVTQASNLKEAVEAVGRAVVVSTSAERVMFFLADRTGGWERYHVHTSMRLDDRAAKLPEQTALLDRARNDLKITVGRVDDGGRLQTAEAGAADSLAIPLVRGGRVSGILYADTPGSRKPIAKNDIDFLATIALQISARLNQFEQVQQLKKENVQLRQKLDEDFAVIVQNERMRKIMAVTERVAESEATVLVTGESGTGKELIAKSIHRFSRRGAKPLVAVNCAALPETLLESELFGHEKGAFTGAVERRIGKFEAADGSTLFLDEIGDISPAAQAKLLRALQEGEITRVGGTKVIKVNVRLITATNKDLAEEVKEGRFRQDLFFRLKVIEIQLPALRERPDDVPALAEHFLKQLRQRSPTSVRSIAPETMRILTRYPFPGNVRELRNIIERGLVFAFGDELLPEHLPFEVLQDPGAMVPPPVDPIVGGQGSNLNPTSLDSIGGTPLSLAELEKRHIQHVLRFTKGNKLKTAALLGISRTTLYEKLKLYNLGGGSANEPA